VEKITCAICNILEIYCKGMCEKCYKHHYYECNKEIYKKKSFERYSQKSEEIKQRSKKYREKNKEIIAERDKRYREKNKDKISIRQKLLYQKQKQDRKIKNKIYYDKNKKRIREKARQYFLNNKDKMTKWKNQYQREKRLVDEGYYIKDLMRSRISKAFRLYSKTGKIKKVDEYGINYEAIIKYLGPCPGERKKYHIDHIIPLALFNFDNLKEIKKAFAPENHQWLIAKENLIKGKKCDIFILESLLKKGNDNE
jgi:hypothetical protein